MTSKQPQDETAEPTTEQGKPVGDRAAAEAEGIEFIAEELEQRIAPVSM